MDIKTTRWPNWAIVLKKRDIDFLEVYYLGFTIDRLTKEEIQEEIEAFIKTLVEKDMAKSIRVTNAPKETP